MTTLDEQQNRLEMSVQTNRDEEMGTTDRWTQQHGENIGEYSFARSFDMTFDCSESGMVYLCYFIIPFFHVLLFLFTGGDDEISRRPVSPSQHNNHTHIRLASPLFLPPCAHSQRVVSLCVCCVVSGKLVSKMLKFPLADDHRICIAELDAKQFFMLINMVSTHNKRRTNRQTAEQRNNGRRKTSSLMICMLSSSVFICVCLRVGE